MQKSLKFQNTLVFLNWNNASTAMEADAVAEGFKRSIELHGLKFNKLIGDGDSSVSKRLLEMRPYGPNFHIEKIECRNHLLRNYGTKLAAIVKNSKFPIPLRNHISSNAKRFRSAITKAIDYRSKLISQTKHQKVSGLRKDITNSFCHIMGSHKHCEKYFCNGNKSNELDLLDDAEKCGLVREINQIVGRPVMHTESLLLNVDNNVCEQFNSIINKHLCGKRINFSLRNSYNTRIESAVVSYNTSGQFLRSLHKHAVNEISPGNLVKYICYKN
ncbi:uncharacterized protein LOC132937382 [Metopolophium dirhodum]|uniref:uncharacterized protein LOC132937382 n=1 Tax=Metopolophium dirhodum TaxID=44670 RepID=UPI00298FF691|nr:uncharacterized protein LOC132937382 [Metopolophium dirhodum]